MIGLIKTQYSFDNIFLNQIWKCWLWINQIKPNDDIMIRLN